MKNNSPNSTVTNKINQFNVTITFFRTNKLGLSLLFVF